MPFLQHLHKRTGQAAFAAANNGFMCHNSVVFTVGLSFVILLSNNKK